MLRTFFNFSHLLIVLVYSCVFMCIYVCVCVCVCGRARVVLT